jgi:hypothetical protein
MTDFIKNVVTTTFFLITLVAYLAIKFFNKNFNNTYSDFLDLIIKYLHIKDDRKK